MIQEQIQRLPQIIHNMLILQILRLPTPNKLLTQRQHLRNQLIQLLILLIYIRRHQLYHIFKAHTLRLLPPCPHHYLQLVRALNLHNQDFLSPLKVPLSILLILPAVAS